MKDEISLVLAISPIEDLIDSDFGEVEEDENLCCRGRLLCVKLKMRVMNGEEGRGYLYRMESRREGWVKILKGSIRVYKLNRSTSIVDGFFFFDIGK